MYAIRSYYDRLVTSAASDGQYLADAVADGEALMVITYNYIDPDKSPDVMTLYAGGTRRVNVDVNGVIEFDISASGVCNFKHRVYEFGANPVTFDYCVITSYTIHYTKLYYSKTVKIPGP